MTNIDPAELARFAALAPAWWDPQGELKALHDINGLRVGYIDRRAPLSGRRVLDGGCGGGILSEAMAARGAAVTGIAASAEATANALTSSPARASGTCRPPLSCGSSPAGSRSVVTSVKAAAASASRPVQGKAAGSTG